MDVKTLMKRYIGRIYLTKKLEYSVCQGQNNLEFLFVNNKYHFSHSQKNEIERH